MRILSFPVQWHVPVIVVLIAASVCCTALPHGPAYYFEGDNTHYHDFSAYPVVYRHNQQPNSYNFGGSNCKLTVVVPEHVNDPYYHLYHPYENDEAFYYCAPSETTKPSTPTQQQQPQRNQQPVPAHPKYTPLPPRQTYYPPPTTTSAPKNYDVYANRYPTRQYSRPSQGTRVSTNNYLGDGSGRGVNSDYYSRNRYRQPDRYAGRYNNPRNYYNNNKNYNKDYYPTRYNNGYYNRRYTPTPPRRASTTASPYYPRSRPSSSYPYARRRRPDNVVGYQKINRGTTNYYYDRDYYDNGSSRRRGNDYK